MSVTRAERVGPLIFEEISRLLVKKIEDPGLQAVTLTRVEMTRDLRIARIYFSLIGDRETIERAARAFDRAKGIFKKAIGKNLTLRYMPELEFHYDRNVAHAERIDQILREIKKEEDLPDA